MENESPLEKKRRKAREYYYANKDASNARSKEYYEKNKESQKQKRREWHAEHREEANAKRNQWRLDHLEHSKQKCKDWYEANKEAEKPKHRAWHHANKETANAKRSIYYQENREEALQYEKERAYNVRLTIPWKRLLHSARYRALKKDVPFLLTEEWAEQNWTGICAVTKIPFRLGQRGSAPKFYSPSIDRIEAAKGYIPENCRFVLWAVNSLKHDGTDADMILVAEAILLNYSYKSIA